MGWAGWGPCWSCRNVGTLSGGVRHGQDQLEPRHSGRATGGLGAERGGLRLLRRGGEARKGPGEAKASQKTANRQGGVGCCRVGVSVGGRVLGVGIRGST